MIVLGIDPGSRVFGYGLLEIEGRRILAAGSGSVRIDTSRSLPERLLSIHESLKDILEEYKPDHAAVETIFYGKNPKSAFTLGHARGAILMTIAQHGIPVFEYSPREVKSSVVGNGNATKQQVRFMITQMLPQMTPPSCEDAADGLAIALCHYNRLKSGLIQR